MDCPRCTVPLKAGDHDGIRAYLCDGCSGCLLERRGVITVLDGMAHALRPHVHPDIVFPDTPGPDEDVDCPACREAMEHYGYMGSRKIMIDGCGPCEWLWLDAGELMAMAHMHVRHDKRMERFEMSSRPADLVGLNLTTRATEATLLVLAVSALRAMFMF